MTKKTDFKKYIREVPDFPKKGILFYDITTLLSDPKAFKKSVDVIFTEYKDKKIDYVVGIESRGFIFGSLLAYKLGAGFVLARKKGKLPHKTKSIAYSLEYGEAELEIHADALPAKSRVLIVDDLLATGGTVEAVAKLVKSFNVTIVGLAFLIELTFLKGRKKLNKLPILSLMQYDV